MNPWSWWFTVILQQIHFNDCGFLSVLYLLAVLSHIFSSYSCESKWFGSFYRSLHLLSDFDSGLTPDISFSSLSFIALFSPPVDISVNCFSINLLSRRDLKKENNSGCAVDVNVKSPSVWTVIPVVLGRRGGSAFALRHADLPVFPFISGWPSLLGQLNLEFVSVLRITLVYFTF